MASFQSLPGFREFYPEALARRNHIFRLWRQTARAFGFDEYDAPVLESLDLYKAKSGEEIEKQLFSFPDKGGREVALRPELTPSVCRMVGAKAGALKRPIKWFNIGEFYRYERMQRGRGRSFFQLNADIFGEPGPEAEVELIALLIQCFTAFGLTEQDFCVRLSDRDLWVHVMRLAGLGDLQIPVFLSCVDKLDRQGEAAFEQFLKEHPDGGRAVAVAREFYQVRGLGALSDFIKSFGGRTGAEMAGLQARYRDWEKLVDGLQGMGLGGLLQVDLSVVRGLAYYTGFVFEAFDRRGDLRALAGGGRYNDLVKKLGGPDLPAVGFAIGDVTTGLLLEERGLMPAFVNAPDVCVAFDGAVGRQAAFPDIQALRAAGFRVEYVLKDLAFGKQLKGALDSGAKLALLYGGDELGRGVVKLRDLTGRTEREVPRAGVPAAVQDFFAGS
jgi:histidyl-tRNA synthetase